MPFTAPAPFIPLSAGAISTLPALLRPYLDARLASSYGLWDDDALPSGMAEDEARRVLAGRPEVSATTGRILLGKRKRDTSLLFPVQSGGGQATVGLGVPLGNKASGYTTAPGIKGGSTVSAKKAKVVSQVVPKVDTSVT